MIKLLLFAVLCETIMAQPPPSVGIIGGGIGGTSAAHFTSGLFEGKLKIDLFEDNEIGGRLSTVDINGKSYEIGGTIIHPDNVYMSRFISQLGLKKREPPPADNLSLSDGKKVICNLSLSSSLVSYLSLLWRYGLSPLYCQNLVDQMLASFLRIYKYQDNGVAFDSVEELLTAMNSEAYKATQLSTKQALLNAGVSEKYIDELVTAVMRVNYGQTADIHSFAGLVSLAGASRGLWSVHGGNKLVPERLLRASRAVHISEKVIKIRVSDSNKTQVISKKGNSTETIREYDLVIIAVPNISDIVLEGISIPDSYDSKFHQTVATLVEGTFALDGSTDELIIINPKSNINSISKNFPVDYTDGEKSKKQVWKIFSQEALTNEALDSLFPDRSATKVKEWKAYPRYLSSQPQTSFKLYNGVYFLNSIELAASAMEMSAVAAKNVALLAYYDWTGEVKPPASLPSEKEL